MILYLSANSRPDIELAVKQHNRFTHNTRAPQKEAVVRICRHIKVANSVDFYVGANLSGVWGHKNPLDTIYEKSRKSYFIIISVLPMNWASNLQNEVEFSNQLAE